MKRLNRVLPKTSPTAMSTRPWMAALLPVMSSGKEVVAATRIRPTHVRPQPRFSARASP
ncbi:hypothetical protein TthAA37_12480 [Thermus thermophilus]|uniref:Uncharacterized protein n=1 Tax=Thermus thermophilus TaxID=274 RepID=A0AAD1KUR5_THETH|nr:hypothetical protein TthAA229_11650 [Thermus thermophilus]BCZ87042.1 hypothetical protein TthAA11_12240 [Thermus thermophilus]BCZ92059.1 hypothetical protein TthAA37_12480 [Thermus thermophilus]BCZ94597.1 hypothetical protein TthAK1_12140 [Thermus thermophilus]